jgi:aspartokinase
MGIAKIKELTSKTRDYLVSFGENMATTIFSAYLNKLGKRTCQVHTSIKCTLVVWLNLISDI